MKGYLYVSSNGTKTLTQLRKWLAKGLDSAASVLPTKIKAT